MDNGGVLAVMYRKASAYGNRAALSRLRDGRWQHVTFQEVQRRAKQLSDYLIEWGVEPGDRIAILSESGTDWGIVLFAIIRAGGIAVPLDTKLTATELSAIMQDCRPRVLFVSRKLVETAMTLEGRVPGLSSVIVMDDGERAELLQMSLIHASREQIAGRERAPDEIALIVYTSGTTGKPKGVMVTFGTLLFQIERLEEILGSGTHDVFLSILPMNHLLELTAGFLGVLHAGGQVCYAPSLYPQDIVRAMNDRQVTLMVAVPMFLKLLRNSISREIGKLSAGKQLIFRLLFALSGLVPSRRIRRLLFPAVHRKLGGRLRGFISGGAPLDIEVARFFDRIGIPVYQGYGLTETGPIISANTPRHYRVGSVGRPLPGVDVRISASSSEQEGEILTRGPHVMGGYFGDADLTAEVIDAGGWLHTGDLGRLDADGYLYVTGRLKNLIVLAAGKKVHPEEVEEVLSRAPSAKEVCVVGAICREGLKAGTEEVCAVVVPADELLARTGATSAELERRMKVEFESLLADLAPYKRPTRLVVRHDPLPRTPTLKVKRQLVASWLEQQGAVPA
jgi:long-chain acyl-CoA synthetase